MYWFITPYTEFNVTPVIGRLINTVRKEEQTFDHDSEMEYLLETFFGVKFILHSQKTTNLCFS